MVELWVNAITGDDDNPGTSNQPLLTPNHALTKISGNGDLVHLEGTFYTGLKFKNKFYDGIVTVDGHDKTLLYAFDGPFQEFDPANTPDRNYNRLSISDSQNIKVKNLEVWGGNECALSLNNSYNYYGLKNIHLSGVRVKYGAPRGIFMGGNIIEGIYIDGCEVSETCYGDTTHNIYLSGGHWDGGCPPVSKIRIRNTVCKYSGGRHGIQLNGRFKDVVIDGCELYHNELSGLSLIGCQDVKVSNNLIYGNNKQCIVIYDYWDWAYWNPGDTREWLECHHPNDNISIENNTLYVGPKQWERDEYHNNKPDNQPCVLINNKVNELFPYRQTNIMIKDNILFSPWKCIVEFGHLQEALKTRVVGNLVWSKATTKPIIKVPWGIRQFVLKWLDRNYPSWSNRNIVANPDFYGEPEYDFIDKREQPDFNFSVSHSTKANLFSRFGLRAGKGRMIDGNFNGQGNILRRSSLKRHDKRYDMGNNSI